MLYKGELPRRCEDAELEKAGLFDMMLVQYKGENASAVRRWEDPEEKMAKWGTF